MSNLIQISKMTSMEIAEVTGKLHHHIIRDIKDEIEKLENAGLTTETKFGLSERKDSTGRTVPYYELTKEGVLQLAARYDAVARAKLIDLAMKVEQHNSINPYDKLSPELKAIFIIDNKMQHIESRVDKLDEKLDNRVTVTYNQAKEINKAVKGRIIEYCGGKETDDYKHNKGSYFRQLYNDLYDRLGVPSYRDVREIDYDAALSYIKAWLPKKMDKSA